MKNKLVPLVVTTAHKGVFFGYGEPTTDKTIRIEQAQMCVYWTEEVRGVVGLAANGPVKGCKVGPPAPAITLQDVTGIMEATEKAVTAWKDAPWN
jgi:hypothetical protein